MTLDQLTAFFGWMAVLNILYLVLVTVSVCFMRSWVQSIHGRLFGLKDETLNEAYFSFLSHYKAISLIFTIIPYLALRIIS